MRQLVAAKAVDGLSFGYRVRGARRGRVRELTDLDLVEISLVARPMQPLARVQAAPWLIVIVLLAAVGFLAWRAYFYQEEGDPVGDVGGR